MPLSTAPAEAAQRLAHLLTRPAPRLALAKLNTPIQRLPGLDVGRRHVWVKRDDESSALYGGAKIRKLEYVLAAPRYREGDILAIGAIGSHQLVALSLFLGARGGRLSALCFDQQLTAAVKTNFAVTASAIRAQGGRLTHAKSRLLLPIAWIRHQLAGSCGYYLSPGASNPVGCLGFVSAGLELASQVRAKSVPQPRRIYIAAGTAGSGAGLAIGLALCGLATELCLVSSVERWAFNQVMFRVKLNQIYAELRARGLKGPAEVTSLLKRGELKVRILHDAVGQGYGVPTSASHEAVDTAASIGVKLETTYTGKCLAAMREDLRAPSCEDGDFLFWNTHASQDISRHIARDWEHTFDFPLPPPPEERST